MNEDQARDGDSEYLLRRAEEELDRAAASACPEAVKVHYTLAGFYLDRVYGGEGSATNARGFVNGALWC